MADKNVSVRVGVSTPGAESLKSLNEQLRQAGAQAGRTLADPTKPISEGAEKARQATERMRGSMDATQGAASRLRGAIGGLASQALPDPTAVMRSGIDRTRASADALVSRLTALASATAAAGGLRAVTREAIQFESAIADVAKVLDGGGAAAAQVRGEIERLAKVLPVTQQGLAQIAAAGASAGVGIQDLPAYIETVAKASTAFNMTAEETGQAFGNLNSVYKLNQEGLRLLADGINYVGNKSATSERNVIDVVQRVASLGEVAGISRQQILALSGAALPALGNRSEVAATAMESLLGVLSSASSSDKKVKNAFDQMGINIDAFQKRIRTDAVGALTEFRDKVQEFDSIGQMRVMQDLFGKENDTKVLAILANLDQAQQLMQGLGDKTKYAGGLQDEFAQRAATTENQLTLLGNQVRQMAINLGTAFLPALVKAAEALGVIADKIADFARANPALVQGLTLAATAAIGLRTAGAALAFLLPGLSTALTAAGAAAVAGGGGFATMRGIAGALATQLGGLKVAMLGVIALLPVLAGEVEKSNQRTRAELGNSTDLKDAEAGLASIRGEITRLNETFKDDKGSEAYRANLFLLTQREQKALETVKARRKEQEAADQSERERQAEMEREARRGQKTLPPVVTPGKTYLPPIPGTTATPKAEVTGDDIRRAVDVLVQAEIEADRKRIQAQNDVLNAELDASLQQRLISQQDYIDKKLALDVQMLEDERALLERTRETIESALAIPGIKPDEKDRLLAELARLDADVEVLLDKEKTLEIKARLDSAKLAEDIRALKDELSRDIAELTGDTLGATLEQIRQEKERLLNDPRFQNDPELRAQIERRAALKETQATYNEKKRIVDETTAYLQLKEQEYQRQLDAGEISMLERERATAAARKEAADKLREQIDVMRELAGTNPAMLLQVAQLEAQWVSLSKTVDQVALSINQAFAGGFVSAVEAALNGTEKSLTGFLKRIALAAVQSWQQAAGNQLNSMVMKWLGGTGGIGGVLSQFLGGGFGGLGSALSNMFGGFFANGGDYPANKFIVVGENGPEVLFPGVSGSIATNAALTGAVQSMTGNTRQGGGASVAAYAPAAPVFSPVIRIINEDSPQRAREAMDSAEGDSVIRNSLERNSNFLRQLMGVR